MLLLSKKLFHSISSLLFYPFQNRRSILLPHYDRLTRNKNTSIYIDIFNLQPSLYYKKSSLSQINALDFTNEIVYLSCKIFRQLVTKK